MARLLGTNELSFVGFFAPFTTWLALDAATSKSETGDFAFRCFLAAGIQWVVWARSWRVGLLWNDEFVVVRNQWRQHHVRWNELSAIELGGIPTGRGVWPGPILRTRQRSLYFCTVFVFLLGKRRRHEVRPFVETARRHGVPVTVDGFHWRQWSGVAVEADAFRDAFVDAPRDISEFAKWLRRREFEREVFPDGDAPESQRVFARRSARVRLALRNNQWSIAMTHQSFSGWYSAGAWLAALDGDSPAGALSRPQEIDFIKNRIDEAMVQAREPGLELRLHSLEPC